MKKKIESSLDVINFSYTQPTGDDFDDFVKCIHEALPKGIPYDTLYESCLHVAGEEITDDCLSTLAWMLAGNLRRLRNGLIVQPWSGTHKPEWVPVQILSAKFDVSKWGKQGAHLEMKALAGRPCTQVFTKFWTTAFCHTFAARMGFSRFPSGPYPFQDVRELVNLRLYVEVQPNTPQISFDQIAIPPSLVAWNLRYIKRRARVNWPCPKKKPDSLPCYRCAVGQDQCPVSLHPTTYFKESCSQCQRLAWFETVTDPVCVDCTTVNIIKGESS